MHTSLKVAIRAWLLASIAALSAGTGWAQPATVIEPSAASQCLQSTDPNRTEPEYPFEAYKSDKPGRVTVTLRFAAPDRAPDIEVVSSEGGNEFVLNVRRFARTLRVPCMSAGETAALMQEYVFQTNQARAQVRRARDTASTRHAEMLACRKHLSGERMPEYPIAARRLDVSGNVVVRLRYTAPDEPPEVLQVAHVRDVQVLGAAVRNWVKGYRIPCMVPGQDEPVVTLMTFKFHFTGYPAGFRPLTLQQFMQHVDGIDRQTLHMDTTTMGCPFDVLFHYLKPHMPNRVSSVGEDSDAASREPLLKWLREAHLKLSGRHLTAVYGDTADITVPCATINLKPKE